MDFVVATIKEWNIKRFNGLNLEGDWHLITLPDEYGKIALWNPRYVFFTHLSWLIPKEIYGRYECVIFHMTNLPWGRSWEPLQHLIMRGCKETIVSAIRCVKDIDAGDIYMKRPMSLRGSAEEIYIRCSDIVFDMIEEIASKELKAETPQVGEPVYFEKWASEDYRLPDTNDLGKVYDTIRMMDAETYPPCFLETDKLRLEFSRATLRSDHIEANVVIRAKG